MEDYGNLAGNPLLRGRLYGMVKYSRVYSEAQVEQFKRELDAAAASGSDAAVLNVCSRYMDIDQAVYARFGANSAGGCFIATAAYGSYSDARVLPLREFRDVVLNASDIGRQITRMYYRISPPIAVFISTRPKWRRAVQMLFLDAASGVASKVLADRTRKRLDSSTSSSTRKNQEASQ